MAVCCIPPDSWHSLDIVVHLLRIRTSSDRRNGDGHTAIRIMCALHIRRSELEFFFFIIYQKTQTTLGSAADEDNYDADDDDDDIYIYEILMVGMCSVTVYIKHKNCIPFCIHRSCWTLLFFYYDCMIGDTHYICTFCKGWATAGRWGQ